MIKRIDSSRFMTLGCAVLLGGAALANAQSADALLNKLVEKGVLTKAEADELKKESNAGFDKAYRAKTGLPEWVDQLKFYGDVRGRFELLRTPNDDPGEPNKGRDRMRYRMRFGATITMKEDFEVGVRLTSSDPNGGFGGDPISGNTTFQDNGSKKFVYIDLAYGRWTPINDGPWFLSGTFGKMENPFVTSGMVFDSDYTPEGLGLQSRYQFLDDHSLKLNAALFVLDEINQGAAASDDPILYGIQARYDAKWLPDLTSTMGVGWYVITEAENLGNVAVPNSNVGNTRNAAGNLVWEYYPIAADLAFTYTLPAAPLYPGKFPIVWASEYIHNPGADVQNDGAWTGIAFGKTGKKGSWEMSVRYMYLDNNAQYEEFTESDFGAYYAVAHPNSAAGAGYRSGPGTQGWIIRTGYSLSDSFTLSATWYYTDLIHPGRNVVTGDENETTQHRVQLDANWKF